MYYILYFTLYIALCICIIFYFLFSVTVFRKLWVEIGAAQWCRVARAFIHVRALSLPIAIPRVMSFGEL